MIVAKPRRRYAPEIGHLVGIAGAQPGGFEEIHLVVAAGGIEHETRLHAAPVGRIEHVPAGAELRLHVEHRAAQAFGKLRVLQHLRPDQFEAVGQRVVTAPEPFGDWAARHQRLEGGAGSVMPGVQALRGVGGRRAAIDRGIEHAQQCLAVAADAAADQRRPVLRQFDLGAVRAGHAKPPPGTQRTVLADVVGAALDQFCPAHERDRPDGRRRAWCRGLRRGSPSARPRQPTSL